jgi:hypothetical protein
VTLILVCQDVCRMSGAVLRFPVSVAEVWHAMLNARCASSRRRTTRKLIGARASTVLVVLVGENDAFRSLRRLHAKYRLPCE